MTVTPRQRHAMHIIIMPVEREREREREELFVHLHRLIVIEGGGGTRAEGVLRVYSGLVGYIFCLFLLSKLKK